MASRFYHPAWTGVVLPLVLAIGATFTPSTVRALLLIAAVVAAVWTFHLTEYAKRELKKTTVAALVFVVIAGIVFFAGHILDMRAATQTSASSPKNHEKKDKGQISVGASASHQADNSGKIEMAKSRQPPLPGVRTSVGTVTAGPCSVIQIGGRENKGSTDNCNPPEQAPNPTLPEIVVSTQAGLNLEDFPDGSVSMDMLQHLRRHALTVRNPNTIALTDFVMRFQFPEPVVESLMAEDQPAGVEIAWHACRVSFALIGIGAGASAEPNPDGGTKITTADKAGSGGIVSGRGEVCSAVMDNKKLHHTGIYQLRIERLPAVTEIRLAFLTSDSPEEPHFGTNVNSGDSAAGGLDFYGDGHYQFPSGGHLETRDVFLPMQFDKKSRLISSSPSSGEHGKINKRYTSLLQAARDILVASTRLTTSRMVHA